MLTRNIYLISMFEFPHLVIFDIPVSCPLVRTIPETFMSGRDKSWLQILPGNNCQPRLFSQELFATMFKDGLLGEKEKTEPARHWLCDMVQEFIHDLIGLNITESLRNCENLRHRHCRHRGCHLTHKYFLDKSSLKYSSLACEVIDAMDENLLTMLSFLVSLEDCCLSSNAEMSSFSSVFSWLPWLMTLWERPWLETFFIHSCRS